MLDPNASISAMPIPIYGLEFISRQITKIEMMLNRCVYDEL